jgi:hypothetical protein
MSYKTDRLVQLFPDAYAAEDRESLLYKLLDAFGAEFMVADEKIKRLLKSHWVKYAEGDALDNLAAMFGVVRRQLRSDNATTETEPQFEPDEDFRRRLQSIVPLFTGGGTRRAIIGAVRSALGLPFDLNQLNLPSPAFDALRQDLEALVTLTEFSPQGDRVLENKTSEVDDRTATELVLTVKASSVEQRFPRIEWTFDKGNARTLRLTRLDSNRGLMSRENFLVEAGQTLVLTAADNTGRLSAFINLRDVSDAFVNLDGTSPALLPPVPPQKTQWSFRAQSALFSADKSLSRFDAETFDLPQFHVALIRLRLEPLTFDVQVPYFLDRAVAALVERHRYPKDKKVFVFTGIPLERIQDVVNQTRAAGVRGSVHFSLTFLEDHTMLDRFRANVDLRRAENHQTTDALLVANVSQQTETQAMNDRLTIVGVFDVSTFGGPFGFM